MKIKLLITIFALIAIRTTANDFIIVKDARPVAVIRPVGNDSVMKVANLFNQYIAEITGVELQMKHLKGGYQIRFEIVSPEILSSYHPGTYIKNKDVIKDAFSIVEMHGFMSFSATTLKGLENAVHSFMEKYAGVRHYAHDAVIIPKLITFTVPAINWLEVPAFSFRTPYYYEATFQNYIDFHKLSASPKDTDKPSWPVSSEWGLWVHTMHRLLPPEQWFEKHPEYFALRNGIRMTDQACLSNPEVLEIVCRNLQDEIMANPEAKYWSVSQMDNFNYCECDKCRAIDSIEGSPSGTVIRFTNEIARRFPDKVISTLAYQYTRKAPKITKPLPNVNIMLCTIECNRNVPIGNDNLPGSFYYDLKSWSALTSNILVWDYVINFSHLLAPFPNFHVLAPNLQLFKRFGVEMIFEQGLRGCRSGEFNELRCYMLTKLMWNPDIDVDSLMNDFIKGYYGDKASYYVKEYIARMTNNLEKSDRALTLYEPPFTHSEGFMSPENLEGYYALLEEAGNLCNDDSVAVHRIEMIKQSLRYAKLEVAKSLPFTDHWIFEKEGDHMLKQEYYFMLDELVSRAEEYGPELFHEISIKPEEYRKIMSDYFANGIVRHKAIGAEVSYETEPNSPYLANGSKSLTDGVKGTMTYQMLWQGWWGKDLEVIIDLRDLMQVSSVKVGYLDDNQSWIMAPRAVNVWISDDASTYRLSGSAQNKAAGLKLNKDRSALVVELGNDAKARYIKVKVENIGKLPLWRGVEGDAWLFVDEIEVY